MANRIRIINFNDSLTTTEAPALARVQGLAAVNNDELVTKQQMIDYTSDLEFASVADIAAVKAIILTDREEGELKYIKDDGWWYCYSAASVLAGDDIEVLMPDDTPVAGRWLRGKFIDTVNAQSIDGIKTFTSFPKKSGTGSALNPASDNEFVTLFFANNKYATAAVAGDIGSDITALEKIVTELALNGEYGAFAGDYGLKTELFLDAVDQDKTIESSSQAICEVNGCDASGLFNYAPYKTYQKDRESAIKKQGICQAATKASYCEKVQTIETRKFESNASDIAWDATRRIWWMTGAGRSITAISEDMTQGLGTWSIAGFTGGNSICVYGDTLFLTASNNTYGTVYKFTINSDGTLVGGLPSGATLAVGTNLIGTTTYNGLIGVACDGTNVYVTCYLTDKIGIAPMSLASWTSSISTLPFLVFGGANAFRGLAYDGTNLWLGNCGDNSVVVINKTATFGFGRFQVENPYGLEFKDGDLYCVMQSNNKIEYYKVKNTTIHEGTPIGCYLNHNPTEKINDIEYVPNLFGAGVHGYLAVNNTDRTIRVFDAAFGEPTSGTPQSTTVGDGTGYTITNFAGICSDGTNVIVTGQSAANGYVIKFPISSLDGTFAMSASDAKIASGLASIYGVDIIPGTSDNEVVYYNGGANNHFRKGNLTTGVSTVLFSRPTHYNWLSHASTGITLAFKNARELYITDCAGYYLPPIVIDYPMSQYAAGSGNPVVMKVLGNYTYCVYESWSGATFNAAGDLVTGSKRLKLIYVLASDSASDKAYTGLGARRFRLIGMGNQASSTQPVTYPYAGSAAAGKKVLFYKRKYAASVYANKNHVLPLRGVYVLNGASLAIIDYETNSVVMEFMIPVAAVGHYNMLDGSAGATNVLQDMTIIDDKIFLGCVLGIHVIDFVKNKAYMLESSALYECAKGIEDRNYSSTTFANVWATSNPGMTLQTGNVNIRCVHAKQDTSIVPAEHNGTVAAIDNGEIYVAYGTLGAGGAGLMRWKEQRTFILSASSSNNHVRIADDWSYFIAYLFGNNQFGRKGDVRRIYANNATVDWDTQTGTAYTYYDSSRGMMSTTYNDFDIKTIWENGIAKNYALVAHGTPGSSAVNGLEIINWETGVIERIVSTTSILGYVACAWGRDGTVYAAAHTNTASASYIYEARKSSTNAWLVGLGYTHLCPYGAYGTFVSIIRGLTYSENVIAAAYDDCVILIERPRATSRYESKTHTVTQPEKMFYIANDSNGQTISGKVGNSNVFSDVSNARFTFTDGSVQAWNAITTLATHFGGNYRMARGQSGGGTQPKVSWSTVAACTELAIYKQVASNHGKIDITVTDTLLGLQSFTFNNYASQDTYQHIDRIAGLTPEVHTVTWTPRSDKDAASSDYVCVFEGCVELSETATDRALPAITYAVSNDQEKATKHWHTMSGEAVSEDIVGQELYSGNGVLDTFQLPATNLGADITLVELYIGAAWVSQEEIVAWTADSPLSGQITVTFVVPPASGTNNVRITFVQQGTLAKNRFNITYGAGTSGLEDAWVNDVGYYLRNL
jgi:hypothetical protein